MYAQDDESPEVASVDWLGYDMRKAMLALGMISPVDAFHVEHSFIGQKHLEVAVPGRGFGIFDKESP